MNLLQEKPAGTEAAPAKKRFPVAREGLIFILPLLALTVLFWAKGWMALAVLFTLATAFVTYFFRDPERAVPQEEDAVISPADGKVIKIEPVFEHRVLKAPATKISIFMSVFNVHVNRAPLTGRVLKQVYTPGKFFSANRDKASLSNEQNALLMENPEGDRLLCVQIAGLIARRIVCRVSPGDVVHKGARFGMIRFGSRLDVYLPETARVNVRVGQKVKAGQTVLGYMND